MQIEFTDKLRMEALLLEALGFLKYARQFISGGKIDDIVSRDEHLALQDDLCKRIEAMCDTKVQ